MNTNMHRRLRRKTRAGFSLIELTLVLAIIGVLAAFAAYSLVGVGERSRRKATMANMQTIRTAINMYHAAHNGQYPPTLDALMAGRMPFLDDAKGIEDGWGREFIYSTPGTSRPFDLMSLGGDGVYGTEDDLDIWNLPKE
jgi:general secretion pathway protein G